MNTIGKAPNYWGSNTDKVQECSLKLFLASRPLLFRSDSPQAGPEGGPFLSSGSQPTNLKASRFPNAGKGAI